MKRTVSGSTVLWLAKDDAVVKGYAIGQLERSPPLMQEFAPGSGYRSSGRTLAA
jgi:hypothetical protein